MIIKMILIIEFQLGEQMMYLGSSLPNRYSISIHCSMVHVFQQFPFIQSNSSIEWALKCERTTESLMWETVIPVLRHLRRWQRRKGE